MSDDNPYVIPEMDPTLRKQIQECNWQIVNVTTPANYFHVLRRQVVKTQLYEYLLLYVEIIDPFLLTAPHTLFFSKCRYIEISGSL